MRNSKWLRVLIGLGLFLALVVTAASVLGRRVEEGASYPEYSSFRDDPKGTRVAYDALSELPGITVDRNLFPLSLFNATNTCPTLILAGADAGGYLSSDANLDLLEKLAGECARVIVAIKVDSWSERLEKNLNDGPLVRKWQVRLAKNPGKTVDEDEDEPDTPVASPFHVQEAHGWTIVRSYQNQPVYFERKLGKGTIGLLSEPFLISNFGLAGKLDPAMMPLIIGHNHGPNRTVIFDETHLGVSESGSIAGLIRRYHLQGAIPALVIAALLFVWRNSAPFPPPRQTSRSESNAGRDSRAGLQSLLARNVRAEQLLPLCAEMVKQADSDRVRAIVISGKHADPVETYVRIQRELNPGRKAT